MKARRNT